MRKGDGVSETRKKLRSTTDEEKAEKKQFILNTSLQLYEAGGYILPSADKIAKTCGFAKGTLYTYFETKEEIFLDILISFFNNWFGYIEEEIPGFLQSNPHVSIDLIIQKMLVPVMGQKAFLSLVSRIELVLEGNVSQEKAIAYKLKVKEGVDTISSQLKKFHPFFGTDAGRKVIVETYAILIGFWHQSKIPPALQKLLEESEAELLYINFEKDLPKAIKTYWLGCLADANT